MQSLDLSCLYFQFDQIKGAIFSEQLYFKRKSLIPKSKSSIATTNQTFFTRITSIMQGEKKTLPN